MIFRTAAVSDLHQLVGRHFTLRLSGLLCQPRIGKVVDVFTVLVEIALRLFFGLEDLVAKYADLSRDVIDEPDRVVSLPDDGLDRIGHRMLRGVFRLGKRFCLFFVRKVPLVFQTCSLAPIDPVLSVFSNNVPTRADGERSVRMFDVGISAFEFRQVGEIVNRTLEILSSKLVIGVALRIDDAVAVENCIRLDRERNVNFISDLMPNPFENFRSNIDWIWSIALSCLYVTSRIIFFDLFNSLLVGSDVDVLVFQDSPNELVAACLVEPKELFENRKCVLRVIDPLVEVRLVVRTIFLHPRVPCRDERLLLHDGRQDGLVEVRILLSHGSGLHGLHQVRSLESLRKRQRIELFARRIVDRRDIILENVLPGSGNFLADVLDLVRADLLLCVIKCWIRVLRSRLCVIGI